MVDQETLDKRFWKRVNVRSVTECWLWTAGTISTGYGAIWNPIRRRMVLAHRFSWELHRGAIPTGLAVCHHCDVPLCVNPYHLFIGTLADNNTDKVQKGRQSRGLASGSTNLSEGDVVHIRTLLKAGKTQQFVADLFGMTQSGISRINTGSNWSYLPTKF